MLIGSRTGWCSARAVTQSSSFQVYREVNTTDAVAGGRSAALAIGSAFSRHTPSGPQIAYLYLAPSVTPGTKSSHTPDAAERAHRVRAAVPVVEVAGDADTVGVRRPDGEGRAGGLADLADVRAEHAPQFLVPALADQVQVELAQRRQVTVRIVAHLSSPSDRSPAYVAAIR